MSAGRDRSFDRALEAGEREMGLAGTDQRPGQRDGVRITALRQRFDSWATGVRQAEQLCGLVEGLASRIVDGGREAAIIADAAHLEQLAMTAGDKQQQVGKT